MKNTPAAYWRQNKTWAGQLGKRGTVVQATTIRVASPELTHLTPYSYAIVDFDGEKKELMSVGHELVQKGDVVTTVLRKMDKHAATSLVAYGIKIKKVA